MRQDLKKVLELALSHRLLRLVRVSIEWLELVLAVRLEWSDDTFELDPCGRKARIFCRGAIDYAFRPIDPEQEVSFEVFSRHRVLEAPGIQYVPGGDGEKFDPPKQFKLLIFGPCYVIAEAFELEWVPPRSGAGNGEDGTPTPWAGEPWEP